MAGKTKNAPASYSTSNYDEYLKYSKLVRGVL